MVGVFLTHLKVNANKLGVSNKSFDNKTANTWINDQSLRIISFSCHTADLSCSFEQVEVLSLLASTNCVHRGSVWIEHDTFIHVYEQTWTWSALWRIDSAAKSTSIVETRRLNYGPNNFRLGKLYRDWLLDDVSCRINLVVCPPTPVNRSRLKVINDDRRIWQ